MNPDKILDELISNPEPIKDKTIFSKFPGIYALFFIGEKFPIENYVLPSHRLIYIGKTESSQLSRDCNTHFKTGKTGSSTVRKSIGALLSQNEELNSIVRNNSDKRAGRISHFKFDELSEKRITNWMFDNLAVSFFEYPESKELIDNLETQVIRLVVPVLNIDHKNPDNIYKSYISNIRKSLAEVAFSRVEINSFKSPDAFCEGNNFIAKRGNRSDVLGSCKYIALWKKYVPTINKALKERPSTVLLNKSFFQDVGNRKDYSFTLKYVNGRVANNINGSAVARNFNSVLLESGLDVNNCVFKLNKNFELSIS